MKKNILAIMLVATFSLTATIVGCKKFVQIDPPKGSIVANIIYEDPSYAAGALSGIYYQLAAGSSFSSGINSLARLTGLSSDELTLNNLNDQFLAKLYKNDLSGTMLPPLAWNDLYGYIYRANSAIEGLNSSSKLTSGIKNQLLGEAMVIRAFCYFYLVNLYGNVPLALTTDYKVTGILGRSSKDVVYTQIINDLKQAITLLNENYLGVDAISSTNLRLRPNKAVANALLSRVYLYTGQWANAESNAALLINDSRFGLESLSRVFLVTSKEAIWQLDDVDPNFNTFEGPNYILAGQTPTVYLSSSIYEQFETSDQRKTNWVSTTNFNDASSLTPPYAFKYKVLNGTTRSEYLMIFRLAEQYLIRAEARAQLGKITGVNSAETDLNMIRNRAGLPNTTATTQAAMLDAILNERKFELFCEWGHRWFDLKRTGKIDQVMPVVTLTKGGTWKSTAQLYPIPQDDINKDPGLKGQQNPGY